MNRCVSPEQFQRLLDEQLSPAERDALESHVEACTTCEQTLARLLDDPADDLAGVAGRLRGPAELAALPAPAFLRRLQRHPPPPLTAAEAPDDGDAWDIHFPDPPTALGPLGRLESYHIIAELGRGAFGVVFQAHDENLNCLVALKVLKPEVAASTSDRARFEREARAAAAVRDDHVVTIYRVGSTPGFALPYLVMEYIDGEALGDHLARHGALGPREAATLARQVALGLAAAHTRGLVHRDIKPNNIMLERGSGRAKITDFGLARAIDVRQDRITQSGGIVGTPAYMSPEQILAPQQVDGRSDLYGLGVLLYEALTGESPFRGQAHLILQQVVADEPVPPRRLNDAIPRDLETITLQCLAKEPGRRYQTAGKLAEDLQRWLDGEPIRARPVGSWERAWKWARRRPAAAALLLVSGVAALALVGVAVAFIYNQRLEATNAELGESNQRTEAALDLAKFHQYFHYINRAHASWREGDLTTVEPRLDACPPERRNWEWQYLKRLCHADLLTLTGHTGTVRSVAFSPDGKWLASGSYDKTVKIWDATTGQVERTLQGHTKLVNGVAFSPDGTQLASASEDSSVKIWEARTGRLIHDIEKANGHVRVNSVAFSPDGKQLASAGFDRTVKVWDTTTGQLIRSFRHGMWDLCVAFSPDGSRLASGNAGRTVQVWDWRTAQELHMLGGHTAFVNGVAFSPGGDRLASASTDGTVSLWDATTGQELHTLKGHTSAVSSVAFSPDGARLASASGEIKLWDATSGKEIITLKGHTGGIYSVAFSPDGSRLASASTDGTVKLWDATAGVESVATAVTGARVLARNGGDRTVKIWDARSGQELRTLTGHAWVDSVAFSPDGARLASASAEGTVKLWDATTGRETRTLAGHPGGVWSVAFSPDSARLASAGSSDKTVKIWDATTGQPLRTLEGYTGFVESVAFSPDGTRLASGSVTVDEKKKSSSGEVKIWDATTWKEIRTLEDFTGTVFSVAFSPDGTWLASGSATWDEKKKSSSGEVKIWDPMTGQLLRRLTKHTGAVISVAFSPDGTRIASAGRDQTVKVWDATTGQELHTFPARTSFNSKVAFSPDGRWLTTATGDDTVQVWDATTGQVVRTLHGHGGEVRSVVFSPDGSRIASAGRDRTAKVWETKTGQDARTLTGHTGWVHDVVFSPDGTQIASAGADQTVRLWDLTTGQEIRTLRGQTGNVYCVAFSPDGTRLACGVNPRSGGSAVKIWDPRSGQLIPDFKGHVRGEVYCVVFSPDGARIASLDHLRTVKVWDTQTGQEQLTFQADKATYTDGVAFSPDGKWLASPSGDGTIKLRDATTGKELITYKGHTGGGIGVAFSPDGTRLASGGHDEAVRVWNTTTGQEVLTLQGHKSAAGRGLTFSPDGTRLASGSMDQTVKIWDAATGEEILTLQGHKGTLGSVAFSPDGKWLVSCSWDGTIKLWDARPWAPEGRVEQQALALLDGLFARPLGRADVVAHLRSSPTLAAEVRSRAMALLERYREETKPEAYHQASWAVARQRYLNAFPYGFALRQAESACRLAPAQGKYQTGLGVAQYRAGHYREALETLQRAGQLSPDSPVVLAFLAMAHGQLGQKGQAHEALARLREQVPPAARAPNEEATAFLREAEALLQAPAAARVP